ncbi:HAD hydrolase, subfamily IA [Kipferlia bialata]|uniref:HAD hydrolase, subfamily IA n=1 Tax=Kipferlia bialata TaxID=797122 RepID=A0A9K3CQC4_9EUKA|nr:HAD hydrolase, subfamily IA [Kipferlia bialata]|eukprot:g2285.t1
MYIWHEVDRRFFAEFGMEVPENLVQVIEGMNFTACATYMKDTYPLVDWPTDKIIKYWEDTAVYLYSNEVLLRSGCKAMLSHCVQGRVSIATSLSRNLLEASLSRMGLTEWFAGRTFTSGELNTSKPKPEVYLAAASCINVDPSKCIVFEDTLSGVKGGKNAGCRVVNIREPCSDHSRAEIDRLSDLVITSWDDMLIPQPAQE